MTTRDHSVPASTTTFLPSGPPAARRTSRSGPQRPGASGCSPPPCPTPRPAQMPVPGQAETGARPRCKARVRPATRPRAGPRCAPWSPAPLLPTAHVRSRDGGDPRLWVAPSRLASAPDPGQQPLVASEVLPSPTLRGGTDPAPPFGGRVSVPCPLACLYAALAPRLSRAITSSLTRRVSSGTIASASPSSLRSAGGRWGSFQARRLPSWMSRSITK